MRIITKTRYEYHWKPWSKCENQRRFANTKVYTRIVLLPCRCITMVRLFLHFTGGLFFNDPKKKTFMTVISCPFFYLKPKKKKIEKKISRLVNVNYYYASIHRTSKYFQLVLQHRSLLALIGIVIKAIIYSLFPQLIFHLTLPALIYRGCK